MNLLQEQKGLIGDLQTLDQLQTVTHNIKSFDFDGKKYKIKEVADLSARVKKEKEDIDQRIVDIDRKAFAYFYQRAKHVNQEERLLQYYQDYAVLEKAHEENTLLFYEMQSATQFIQYTTPFVDIRANFVKIYELEKKLKNTLAELLKRDIDTSVLDPEAKKKAADFVSEDLVYFKEPSYNDRALGLLFNANHALFVLSADALFSKKKELLAYQINL